jgi:hypothetical protein
MVHTALRPYVTTGIAIVGASVVAVAPVTMPPRDVAAVEVAAVDTVRTVTVDVELTALVDLIAAVPTVAALLVQAALQPVPLPPELKSLAIALANAGVPAVTETVKLWTETLPASALTLISTGKFAHLAVLAVNAVYLGTLTPIAPFAVALMEAVPLPLGTTSGVINQLLDLGIKTPFVTATSVLALAASVIDDGLSPFDALVGAVGALSTGLTLSVAQVQKILATLSGALPFSALAARQVPDTARATSFVADLPAANDAYVAAVNANSCAGSTKTLTVAVDSAVQPSGVSPSGVSPSGASPEPEPEAVPDVVPAEATSSDDESVAEKPAEDDEAVNGATDLSDGNAVKPSLHHDEPKDGSGDKSSTADEIAVEDHAAATTDAAAGSDEGSDAGDASAGE